MTRWDRGVARAALDKSIGSDSGGMWDPAALIVAVTCNLY